MKMSVSSRIADRIRREILGGSRLPGERIRQEEIAEEFGASRLPVREALRILVAEGLVSQVANTGAWVAQMDLAACTETYLIRERLDALLLRCAVPKYTDSDIARLRELYEAVESTDTVTGYLEADRTFHLESYKPACMDNLYGMVEGLWNTTHHYRRTYSQLVGWDGLQLTHLEHRLMLDSFVHRDEQEAERLMASHIRKTRLELARHPEIFNAIGQT